MFGRTHFGRERNRGHSRQTGDLKPFKTRGYRNREYARTYGGHAAVYVKCRLACMTDVETYDHRLACLLRHGDGKRRADGNQNGAKGDERCHPHAYSQP